MAPCPCPDTYRPFDAEDILGNGFALFLPVTLAVNSSYCSRLSLVGVSWKHSRHTVPAPVTPVPLRGLDH